MYARESSNRQLSRYVAAVAMVAACAVLTWTPVTKTNLGASPDEFGMQTREFKSLRNANGGGDSGAMASRKDTFKKGMDESTARRQREEWAIDLRKNKREERMNKRRFVLNQTSVSGLADKAEGDQGPAPTLADMPNFIMLLKSEAVYERFKGAKGLRRLLSVENPPATKAVEMGAIAPLIEALKEHKSTELQFEAAWALTNIASTDFTRQVVQGGATVPLIAVLNSPSADVREQAAWCLGNIAGDCPELRDLVLESNALEPILSNIRQPASLSLLRNTVWTLSNLCRGKPPVSTEIARKVVPLLASVILQCNDEDTLIDSCWAFSYLTDGENERIDVLLEQKDVVGALVRHLDSRSSTLIAPALRTLGNIVTGTDEQTQIVIESGILPTMLKLLQHPKKSLRKEACWLLSNIAAGTRKQITALLNEPRLVPEVLQHLSWGQWEVREEAAWVISNLCISKEHVQQVVSMGAIRPLCELLTASDPNLVLVVLGAIESILQVSEEQGLDYDERIEDADGLDKLEELQGHKNEEIYLKAVDILERYFPGEEDVGED